MLKHKTFAKKFYNSKAWKDCRAAYIPTVYGLCEHCGKPGYILDHIIEINYDNMNDPNITLNHDNLQYLCLECHNTKTFRKYSATNDGLMFDENGFVVRKHEH